MLSPLSHGTDGLSLLKSLSQLRHFKKVKSNSLWEETAGKDKEVGVGSEGGWDEGI